MSRKLKWETPTKVYSIRIPEYLVDKIKKRFGSVQAMVDFMIRLLDEQ